MGCKVRVDLQNSAGVTAAVGTAGFSLPIGRLKAAVPNDFCRPQLEFCKPLGFATEEK